MTAGGPRALRGDRIANAWEFTVPPSSFAHFRPHRVLAWIVLSGLAGSSLVVGCGGAGAPRGAAGSNPVDAIVFEPDLVRTPGSRAFRILGRGFAPWGPGAEIVLHARTGTPFAGGTSATLRAAAIVDSAQQVRGILPEPGIPRTWPDLVVADVEVRLPKGGGATLPNGAHLEPERLLLSQLSPQPVAGMLPQPSWLDGRGFGATGGECSIRFRSLVGTPFADGTAAVAEVPGTVLSGERISFVPPPVRVVGSFLCEVELALPDGDTAKSDRWYVRFDGPPAPPPFRILHLSPAFFDALDPNVFLVQGSDLQPIGGVATVAFQAAAGTPFLGGTAARVEVPALVLSETTLRAISPIAATSTVLAASVEVRLADGRTDSLPMGSAAFVAHEGVPRLVVNELDYDQPSTDTAEFIELYNAGDGPQDLSKVRVDLINGVDGGAEVYESFALPPTTLPAGGYFTITGNAAAFPQADLVVSPSTNLVQNGAPDGVALFVDGSLADVLSYEGNLPLPYRETSGVGLEDGGTLLDALARWVDGLDRDHNALDFGPLPPTPGGPNAGVPDRVLAAVAGLSPVAEGHVLQVGPTRARGGSLASVVAGRGLVGLAFGPAGELFVATEAVDGATELLQLRARDGALVHALGVVMLDSAPVPLEDLACDPASGRLYALAVGAAGSARLLEIDRAAATAAVVADLLLGPDEVAVGLAALPGASFAVATRGSGARLRRLGADGTVASSVLLEREDLRGLGVRRSDGALLAGIFDSDEIVHVAEDGTTTTLGATGAGHVGDLDGAPLL